MKTYALLLCFMVGLSSTALGDVFENMDMAKIAGTCDQYESQSERQDYCIARSVGLDVFKQPQFVYCMKQSRKQASPVRLDSTGYSSEQIADCIKEVI